MSDATKNLLLAVLFAALAIILLALVWVWQHTPVVP